MTFWEEVKLHQARVRAWELANQRRWFYEKGVCLDYTSPNVILAAAYTSTPLSFGQVIGYFGLN